MAKYRIYFQQTASCVVTVEAETRDEATDLAYEELPYEVCAQCSGWGQSWSRDDGEWVVDESVYEVDGDFIEVKS